MRGRAGQPPRSFRGWLARVGAEGAIVHEARPPLMLDDARPPVFIAPPGPDPPSPTPPPRRAKPPWGARPPNSKNCYFSINKFKKQIQNDKIGRNINITREY